MQFMRQLLVCSAVLMPLCCASILSAAPIEIPQTELSQGLPSNLSETKAAAGLSSPGSDRSVPGSGINYFLGSDAERTLYSQVTASHASGNQDVATTPSSTSGDDSESVAVIPEPGMTVLLLSSLFGGSIYAGRVLRRKMAAAEAGDAR